MSTSSLILQALNLTQDGGSKLSDNDQIEQLLEFNKQFKGTDFLIPLSYYLSFLEQQDSALYPFMSPEAKEECLRKLQVTYLFLSAEKVLEQQRKKKENIKDYDAQRERCEVLIQRLQEEQSYTEKKEPLPPDLGYAVEGCPLKYWFMSLGGEFAAEMVNMADRKTKTIKKYVGDFNRKRLYWVWGSQLIKNVLELLPTDLSNLADAKQSIRYPDPYTGFISWALYYFRFGLNLGLLLKGTIKGPWMSQEEQERPWPERFLTQWNQRKFALLNDSVWATGNLLCAVTLIGTLGPWGDVLTLVLLAFDIALAAWELAETQTQHKKEMLAYQRDLQVLEEQLLDLQDEKQRKEIEKQIESLNWAKAQCTNRFRQKKINLLVDLSYAISLLLSYFLLTTPFIPTLAFLGPVGAVLCFGIGVINTTIKGGIELHRSKQSIKDAQLQIGKIKADCKDLDNDSNEKKLLFLEIKKLMAEDEYQHKNIQLQTAHLIRSILFELIIPTILLVNLVLFPIAVIPALCAVLALTLCSQILINRIFKAERKELTPFNQEEYAKFCNNPDAYNKKSFAFFESQQKLAPLGDAREEDLDLDNESLNPIG